MQDSSWVYKGVAGGGILGHTPPKKILKFRVQRYNSVSFVLGEVFTISISIYCINQTIENPKLIIFFMDRGPYFFNNSLILSLLYFGAPCKPRPRGKLLLLPPLFGRLCRKYSLAETVFRSYLTRVAIRQSKPNLALANEILSW